MWEIGLFKLGHGKIRIRRYFFHFFKLIIEFLQGSQTVSSHCPGGGSRNLQKVDV
jgi:hypothetical protein